MKVLRSVMLVSLCSDRFPHRCLKGILRVHRAATLRGSHFSFSIVILDQPYLNNQIATTNIVPKRPQPTTPVNNSTPQTSPHLHSQNDAHHNQITTTFASLLPQPPTNPHHKHHLTFVPETTPSSRQQRRDPNERTSLRAEARVLSQIERVGDFHHVGSLEVEGHEASLISTTSAFRGSKVKLSDRARR